jgi:hypothetical protein
MIRKTYQRRHLRAPFREDILYADGSFVLKAKALNISEGGLLLDELPSFPEKNEIPLLIAVPQIPSLKNFSLLKIQTFSRELFSRHIVRVKARMVRREQLSQNLDNLFKARFGLEFIRISPIDQKIIDEFVSAFASNIVYLQTLIDSFNTDDETKERVRTLAKILGYTEVEKIAQLRAKVAADYKSLQWL